MVSIPSSQIKNIISFDLINQKQISKIIKSKQNIKSVIKEAENEGYFTIVTSNYLLNKSIKQENPMKIATNDDNIDMLKFLHVINLHHENIQKLDCLEYCRNLVYLNLSKNFISDFTALKLCQKLICLDLSANMIQTLPDYSFWKNMLDLRFLYLHDNPIANPDSIIGLCNSPNITVLTLWDTPLSLRRKYRHFIVNSIWSIKVLDHHFVSDEEIIEDSDFRDSYFRSTSEKLKIMSYRSYDHLIYDMNTIKTDLQQFIVDINQMCSHLSPVLIIQKCIRGFLVRRQKKKNKEKSLSPKRDVKVVAIPNSAKLLETTATTEINKSKDNVKYLKINLLHLNQVSTLENLDREASIINMISSSNNMLSYRSVSKMDQDKCSPEHISRALDSEKVNILNVQSTYQNDIDSKITFRFQGYKPPTTSKTPSTEMIIEKNRNHLFIREADRNYHDKILTQLPEIKYKPVKKTNNNQLFRKAQGCMGLFLLNKWDRTDRDIIEIERFHEKINEVRMIKNEKELNNIKLDEARLRKIETIKSQNQEHKNQIEKYIQAENENLKKISDEVKVRNIETREKKSKLNNEMSFSLDFRSKQTAACKAVDKFEQMTYKQEQLQMNKTTVGDTREKMKLEMETVKAYLENQILSRRTEKRLENAALDLQLLQQTNNRMNDSKMRVEKLKAIRRLVSCPKIPAIRMNVDSLST